MTLSLFDRRALLFLPASRPRAIDKARSLAAEMVILDLEDAVKPEDKDAAREAAEAALAEAWPMPVGIRVNAPGTLWHAEDVAALFLYTTESPVYRQLNAALRDPDRKKIDPWRGYLRLVFEAFDALPSIAGSLYRGVSKDLRADYGKGRVVTWWGVSSCTPKLAVARGFLGQKGKRMLFVVEPSTARSIKVFSAFSGEEELILLPGTQLDVVGVDEDKDGLCTVTLRERAGRLVA